MEYYQSLTPDDARALLERVKQGRKINFSWDDGLGRWCEYVSFDLVSGFTSDRSYQSSDCMNPATESQVEPVGEKFLVEVMTSGWVYLHVE